MKRLSSLFAVFFLIISSAFAGGDISKPASAWWYDIAFEADQDAIRGIPVSRFDPQWASARALSLQHLASKVPSAELAHFKASQFRFSMYGDLNKDGKPERVLVGVYKRKDAVVGRFLAIMRDGLPEKVFVRAGAPGFSALLWHGGALRWYSCMECNEYETIVLAGGKFVLE